MRRKTIFVTLGMIVAASLIGCSADTTDINESSADMADNTEISVENNTETSESSADSNETESLLNEVSVRVISYEIVDFEDSGITRDVETFPNANCTDKATLVMAEIVDETGEDRLNAYEMEYTLVNADGEGYGLCEYEEGKALDDSMLFSFCLDEDTLENEGNQLVAFSVPGEYDLEDTYMCITATSKKTDESAEVIRAFDTSSVGDYSGILNTMQIGDRLYRLTRTTISTDADSNGDGTKTYTSERKYYVTAITGGVANDFAADDFHIIFSDDYDANYAESLGYTFEISVTNSYFVDLNLSFVYNEEISYTDEYYEMIDDFAEFVNTYIIGFGTYASDGTESIIEIDY